MISYANAPETNLDVPLADGKKIHGILRGSLDGSMPLAIMMHGRPGQGNELLQYLGARYLYERGIATLRLSMYDFGKEYRSIVDCTLDDHIADFNDVVKYVRTAGAKQVFAIGHSYGGLTILGSDAQLDGAILWDPTHGLAWHDPVFDEPEYPEKTIENLVIGLGGYGYVYGSEQAAADKALGDTTNWAARKGYPMKFILAAAGPLAAYAKRYYEIADEPKKLVEMQNAHHQFEDSDVVVEQLFRETAEFLLRRS